MLVVPALERFASFGRHYLAPRVAAAFDRHPLPSKDPEARRLIRTHCPRSPGVYGMLDADGRLIYVGKSKQLRARLLSYFYGADDDKSRRILKHTAEILWEPGPHEFAALVRELELIQRWRPRFNVQGQPGRRRSVYLCLGRAPAAQAFVAREPTASAVAQFGPMRGNRRLVDATRRVNDLFQLRDCPEKRTMQFADQGELFPVLRQPPCIRFDIGNCTAPCAAEVSRAQYGLQLREVSEFLNGGNQRLDLLEQQMYAASAARQFERAAALRDVWQSLAWLSDSLQRLRQVRERFHFIYPLSEPGKPKLWYFIRAGRVVAACRAPGGRRAAERAERLLDEVYCQQAEPAETTLAEQVLLTSSWFRKFPEEFAKVFSPDAARLKCSRSVD